MFTGKAKDQDKLISRLFFKMLPVQILIFAMGFINTIVDGAMAGRYIDPASIGVVGLYFAMVYIFNAVGSVMLGGTAVLCGKYMGKGDLARARGIFSLNLTSIFILGVILTLVSVVIPGPIASLLGANEALKHDLMTYITGYAVGIIPMLLAQQIAFFLQMERRDKLGYAGIAGMIFSNVIFDILFVGVLNMGVWGLALATGISNWIYFLILVPYYFTSKAQMRFSFKNILWRDMPELVKIGFPGALLVICIAVRSIVVNRILLRCAGGDGLSAVSAYNMIYGLFIAFGVGCGSAVRILASVFIGEENKASIKKVLKTALTKCVIISCVIAAVTFLIAPLISGIFFSDTSSNVYGLSCQLFRIFSFCIPLILIVQVFTNYLQAAGHNVFVNVLSVFDGFLSLVIPAALLAPALGALGVWIAFPVGITVSLLTVPVYALIFNKRIPRSTDDWLFLKPDFGVCDKDCLDISVTDIAKVSEVSEKVRDFCAAHTTDKKAAYYAALCIEEMSANIIERGFTRDKKPHSLTVRAIYVKDKAILRLKDDCAPFDPKEYLSIVSDQTRTDNLGIRIVYGIADDVKYQSLLGLNVLTVTIKEADLSAQQSTGFLLERRLKELDPDLHRRFRDTAFLSLHILSNYRQLFPEYTDHSELHSLSVIDSCNRLIGTGQIDMLNKNEIFTLLMACYLHDIGMGISEKDYEEFKDVIGETQYFKDHPNDKRADFVRTYHNEFSGLVIEKYAELFDLPSPEYAYAIKQIARGHRKTDLYDEKEYPADYRMPDGSTICLPYLAALVRLADEIDVAASRNPLILYDIELLTDEVEIHENRKLMAVKSLKMTGSSFILNTDIDDEELLTSLSRMVNKMQKTLDYCRAVVETRTPFSISQSKVILVRDKEQ